METTFQSLPDAGAPDLHVSTNFHRTLTRLDSFNSNVTDFILRKCVIAPSFIKPRRPDFEGVHNLRLNPRQILPPLSHLLASWPDYILCSFGCFTVLLWEKAQACLMWGKRATECWLAARRFDEGQGLEERRCFEVCQELPAVFIF